MPAFWNFLLTLLSTAITWGVVELVIFPAAIPHLPMRLHAFLGELEPLAQSSKAGLRPQGEWILIVGDSYAKGNGDWFLSADKDKNLPFQAAHVLHDRAGRDVMNFGLPGAGSAGAWVMKPEEHMIWLDLSWRYTVAPPKTVFAYFYEGNDLDDNLRRAAFHFGNALPEGFIQDPAAIDAYLENFAGARQQEKKTALYNLFALKFARNIVRHELRQFTEVVPKEADLVAATRDHVVAVKTASTGGVNAFRIAGQTVTVDGPLQSPGLELSPPQTSGALLIAERALIRLRALFPVSQVVVVYLPSTLTVYEPASEHVVIQTYHGGRSRWPADAVATRSDSLCRRLRNSAGRVGVGFLDARGVLRAAARKSSVHGPLDWKHLNKDGQEVLGAYLAEHAQDGERAGPCVRLSR